VNLGLGECVRVDLGERGNDWEYQDGGTDGLCSCGEKCKLPQGRTNTTRQTLSDVHI
jgi:hypothetical protein